MTTVTIERAELRANPISTREINPAYLLKKEFGRLVSKLIAIRRNSDDPKLMRGLAERLSSYQKFAPDPLNGSRRFNVTRLIASVDRGMYNK